MSRRARTRAAAVAAKRIALLPLPEGPDDEFEDEDQQQYPGCEGDGCDGGDPMNDYVLPCPRCGGTGEP